MLIVNVNLHASTIEGCEGIKEAFRALQPLANITIEHWKELPSSWTTDERWDAFVLGPNETPFPAYPSEFQGFLHQVKTVRKPLLGICGGHQVLGLAFGSTVGPVFNVLAPMTSYKGLPKVKGLVSIEVNRTGHGLMAGLTENFTLDASHVEALQSVPAGFELLASNDTCEIQVLGHKELPLFGVQCHPEREWSRTDGRRLLANFADVVDLEARST